MAKKKTLYNGQVLQLNLEPCELPDGRTATYEMIRHSGAAAVVPFIADEEVVLVHQFRPAAAGWVWEIPAGRLDPNEEPIDCAERECAEEIGYRPSKLEPLGKLMPALGYSDEMIHLYMATDLVKVEQALEEHEILKVVSMPLGRTLEMIDRGEIIDSKTQVALMMVARRLGLT